MPYKSQAQAGYFHTHKAELEKQGVNVDEWDAATKGKHLPQRAEHGGAMYAQGGPVRNDKPDRFYKTKDRNDYGQFLSTEDRFTGGRKPAGFPEEAQTDEKWSKSKGVGQTEADDAGDCKSLKPVLPNKAGNVSYAKK